MVNFVPLTAEMGSGIWAPLHFSTGFASWQRYCTPRHLVVGVSQTLRRWTEGATYVRHGDHHVGHCPHSCCSKRLTENMLFAASAKRNLINVRNVMIATLLKHALA